MFVHALDVAQQGMKKILIRTLDTDVVVIGIHLAQKINCECPWLSFGTGSTFRYLDITAMSQTICQNKSTALTAFHALTGFNVTSFGAGKSKRTAWSAWNVFYHASYA